METNQVNSHAMPAAAEEIRASTKTYNSGWALMKTMILFFGVSQICVTAAFIVFAWQANDAANKRAFFITGDGTIMAKSAFGDRHAREIEVKAHVSLFFSLMYEFDEHTFWDHVKRALYLIGDDGEKILAAYEGAKTYEELVKTNGVVTFTVDSLWTSMDAYPYKVRMFGRNKYTTSLQAVESIVVADMYVRDTNGRSERNVAGLVIENFNVIKNEPILR